jgi:PadR family transcriptional regulator PadR
LEQHAWISSKWEPNNRGREMRFYRLTPKGRKQLTVEESKWRQLVRAMARTLRPA